MSYLSLAFLETSQTPYNQPLDQKNSQRGGYGQLVASEQLLYSDAGHHLYTPCRLRARTRDILRCAHTWSRFRVVTETLLQGKDLTFVKN